MKLNNTSFMFSLMALSLATTPFVISILVLYALEESLQNMGKLSEELFRGSQLPLLNFPEKTSFES